MCIKWSLGGGGGGMGGVYEPSSTFEQVPLTWTWLWIWEIIKLRTEGLETLSSQKLPSYYLFQWGEEGVTT